MAPLPPHILHLEDNPADGELIQTTLSEEWPGCRIRRVATAPDFLHGLQEPGHNLILSDFSMPGFDGLSALLLARRYRPEVPFIFLSGTIGEENAVEALRQGATDYVLKDRMGRLVAAVRRALEESRSRREREATGRRLREQAELLDKTQDAIFVCDLEDRILFWNRSAERIFGYPAADVMGRRLAELGICRPDAGSYREARQAVAERGEWSGELSARNRSGGEIILLGRWVLVRGETGAPEKLLCLETDVTEQRALERRFLRAQRLESLGALAGGIAHDLNNALAPILMATEILGGKATDPQAARLLTILGNSARHGAALVKQVLTFARGADGGRSEIQPEIVIKEVVRLLRETLARSIGITFEIPGDLGTMMADPTQLNQVLMNLCVNAADAMPQGGSLRIRAERLPDETGLRGNHPDVPPGPYILMAVSDTGSGIPPEIIERIFDPFFTTKGPGRGTGLGLATVQGIVKSHQGVLEVSSEVGRGTEFRAFFPALAAATARSSVRVAREVPPGRGETILLIDDEESVRAIALHLLGAFGYRPIVAGDGPSGLDLFRREAGRVQAVVTDINMPGMQGPELVAALRAIDPQVRVVVMSGLLEAEDAGLRPEKGRLAWLRKPMTGEELLASIRQVLGSDAAAGP